ncbi:MAG: hypothetical protein K1X75_09010 [Leptospirales bacterium]|nr:hypothetical protein [Leptospirales bacterium]
MSALAIITPAALTFAAALLGLAALLGVSWILYIVVVAPARRVKAEQDAPPPQVGYALDLFLSDQNRQRKVSIGLLDSDIKLRLSGIREDQLILRFEKERGLEEYQINIQPGANVYYRPPHGRKIEAMKDGETVESRELIGHAAAFRLAASVKNNRALQYVEFELSVKFVINNLGEEVMRFTLSLTRIFPGVDTGSRNKQGLYGFSRFRGGQEEPTE